MAATAATAEVTVHIGHYISGAGHVGLIGLVFFGGVFQSDPPPFKVTGVSVVTTEEFDALRAGEHSPLPNTDVDIPVAPNLSDTAPDMSSSVDPDLDQGAPDATENAPPDETPDLSDLTAPQPSEVTDTSPTLAPPEPEMAVLIPRDTTRPMARPETRVAPDPVAAPEPDTKIDDIQQDATTPDQSASEAVQDAQEATAPEAATTEIVTEAKEQVALAPRASVRPVLRPPQRTRADTSNKAKAGADAAVAAALAEEAAAPSGPPLTRGEKDALRVSVQNCWVVDVGSQAANVTVTVAVTLDQEGKVAGPVTMLEASGGDDQAIQTAFGAARRAVLRCQRGGYKLPIEKYDHWREIEITFNPEKMRLK